MCALGSLSFVIVDLACGTAKTPEAAKPTANSSSSAIVTASASGSAPAVGPTTSAGCVRAGTERARVAGLLVEGRLDRTVRVIAHADALCPAESAKSWAPLVATLAELGRGADVRALSDRIKASKDATDDAKTEASKALATIVDREKPPADPVAAKIDARKLVAEGQKHVDYNDLALALEKFLAAWQTFHPNGDALFRAAMVEKTRGNRVRAQRLFDRALAEMETITGAEATIETDDLLPRTISTIAFSRAGNAMAVSSPGVIAVIDTKSHRERVRLEVEGEDARVIALSPHAESLALAAKDGTIRVFDLASGKIVQTLKGHSAQPTAIAFAPTDGKHIASASSDKTVRAFTVATGETDYVWSSHTGAIVALAYSEDGHQIATASSDKSVRVFSTQTGKGMKTIHPKDDLPTTLAFSSDGKTLVTSSSTHALHRYVVSTGKSTRVSKGKHDFPWATALSADGKKLAAGADDGTVRIWDATTGEARHTISAHGQRVTALAFSNDGRFLVSAGEGVVTTWDASTGKSAHVGKALTTSANACTFSPDGRSLVIASNDGTVRAWSLEGDGALRTIDAGSRPIVSIAMGKDGTSIAAGAEDGTLRTFDANGKMLRTLKGRRALAFSPDGKKLASATGKGVLVYDWPLGDTFTLEAHGQNVTALSFSPDSKLLASGGLDKTIRIWDMATRTSKKSLEGHTAAVTSLAFSPDGHLLASGSEDNAVRVWNVDSGASTRTLVGHTYKLEAVAFSIDGKTIASASSDRTVRLWDSSSGKLTRTIDRGTSIPLALAFQPGGKRIAVSFEDGATMSFSLASSTDTSLAFATLAGKPNGFVLAEIGAVRRIDFQGDARAATSCRIGALRYPIDLCEDRFVVRGLTAKVFADDGSHAFAEP